MAPTSAWAACAVLLFKVSAGVLDDGSGYEKYVDQGARNGRFRDHVQHYAKNYSDYVKKYAGEYSKDRIAQAKKYEDDNAGHYEKAYAHQLRTGRKYEDRDAGKFGEGTHDYAGHYEREYAHQAGTGHEYEDYYVGKLGHRAQDYAGRHKREHALLPRTGSENEDHSESEHTHDKATASPELLSEPFEQMEGLSADGKAEGSVAKALSGQQQALKRAETTIAKIRRLDAELEANIKNSSSLLAVARGIVDNVRDSFSSHRNQYEHRFDSALEGLDPEALATANSTDVEKAADAARRVESEFEHLDRSEAKALRAQLRAFEKARKAKARGLQMEARKAAREVYRLGMASAKAQRRAGVQGYERVEDETEDASDRLLSLAEAAAERAEGHVEELSSRVEHHLEKLTDRLRVLVRESRRQRLHHAIGLVYKAREEAQQKATRERAVKESHRQERGVRGEAAKERTAAEEAETGKATQQKDSQHGRGEEESGTGEETSRHMVFLAQTSSQELGSVLSVLAFCASSAMVAGMTTVLVLRRCRSANPIQPPLLA